MTVAVLNAAADQGVATSVARALRDAGADVVAPNERGSDVLVVLMSPEALDDPSWWKVAREAPAERVVPVRLRSFDRKLPGRLAAINWLDWDPANPTATFAVLVSAIYADAAQHRLFRQLSHEADAWQDAGRPDALLIDGYGAAQQAHDVLEAMKADDQVTPARATAEFIETSLQMARRRRRRRRRRRGAALVVLLVAISSITSAVSAIKLATKVNGASIVTAGDSTTLDQLPQWSAVQAAEVLVHGSPQQQKLARLALLRALSYRWRLSQFDFIDSGQAAVPFDNGRRTAILALGHLGSGLAILDNHSGALLSAFGIRRRFEHLDAAPDGRRIFLSDPGLLVLDIATQSGRVLVRTGAFDLRILVDGDIVTWTSGGLVQVRGANGRVKRTLPRYGAVLAVDAEGQGGGALVETRPGRYAIVDVRTGAVVALARVPRRPDLAIGDLSPDLRRAVVAGGDGQLWTFGAGQAARPTGIATPSDLHAVLWRSGGRVVLASDSQRGQVFTLPGGEHLGRLCWGLPTLQTLRADRTANVIACDARSVWALPRGPLTRSTARLSSTTQARSRYGELEVRGPELRIRAHGRSGRRRAPWSAPLNSTITAAAFDRAGRRLILGAEDGGVALVALTPARPRVYELWEAPGAAAVTAVGWDARGPVARIAAGSTWRIPACPGCQTDLGLLATLRVRLTGCLTSRQLAWVSADVRRLIGARVCQAHTKL